MILAKSLTLIGFQACGKTTLGMKLAADLHCSFVDTDQLIEKLHPPLSCREIFQTLGAPYFRKLESQVIASLKNSPPAILATGGGSLLQPCNGEILKAQGILVYLKTSAAIIKKRIWQSPTMPAYFNAENPHQSFLRLYQERASIYEKWADYILDTEGLTFAKALQQLKDVIQTFQLLEENGF